MKTITIQPKPSADDPFKLPYPYFISEDGMVGRQDFWNGEPEKLVGFSNETAPGNLGRKGIEVSRTEFFENPKLAIDMFPIFEHKNGNWFTYKDKITSITINEK